MSALSKKKLAQRLDAYGLGYTQQELQRYIDDFLGILGDQLKQGTPIKISKFGTFEVVDKTARVGRNPKTKEEVIISRRKVVRFQSSPVLNNRINHRENDV